MNKYQEALNNLEDIICELSCELKVNYQDYELYTRETGHEKYIYILQELVDRETPLTPTYKNTYIEYKEHYLDKDYEMKYHCPKCDSIVYPIGRCSKCHQNLDWNKYYIIEEEDGHTYYRDRRN